MDSSLVAVRRHPCKRHVARTLSRAVPCRYCVIGITTTVQSDTWREVHEHPHHIACSEVTRLQDETNERCCRHDRNCKKREPRQAKQN